jgi:signal peptidase complex subunit 3
MLPSFITADDLT